MPVTIYERWMWLLMTLFINSPVQPKFIWLYYLFITDPPQHKQENLCRLTKKLYITRTFCELRNGAGFWYFWSICQLTEKTVFSLSIKDNKKTLHLPSCSHKCLKSARKCICQYHCSSEWQLLSTWTWNLWPVHHKNRSIQHFSPTGTPKLIIFGKWHHFSFLCYTYFPPPTYQAESLIILRPSKEKMGVDGSNTPPFPEKMDIQLLNNTWPWGQDRGKNLLKKMPIVKNNVF